MTRLIEAIEQYRKDKEEAEKRKAERDSKIWKDLKAFAEASCWDDLKEKGAD